MKYMSYTKIIIKKRGRTPGLVHISESKTKATLIKIPKMVKTIEKQQTRQNRHQKKKIIR